jgi:tagatose-6-phosphate ketose/aldose isomerase
MKKNTYTLDEIFQQPALWNEVYDLVNQNKEIINDFFNSLDINTTDVVFTGAGSSFFVGETVAPIFQKDSGFSSKAVSTTEIVTNPQYYINNRRFTLLVSFARSGNSPESVAAIELANQVSKNIKHIIITCNKDGKLAGLRDSDNVLVIVLPEESNDKSLAMTSSFTSMVLAAILMGRINKLKKEKGKVFLASKSVNDLFNDHTEKIKELVKIDYERAIFLGSGPLVGIARESHLKLQELTDGKIIAKFDSFLGFRHGPKAVVNNKTLMVYIFSNDEYIRKYEYDLVASIKKVQDPVLSIGIFNTALLKTIENELDHSLSIKSDDQPIDDAYWTIVSMAAVQLFATCKSIEIGLNPDSPSESGAIHRVVQGVNIYEFSYHKKQINQY